MHNVCQSLQLTFQKRLPAMGWKRVELKNISTTKTMMSLNVSLYRDAAFLLLNFTEIQYGRLQSGKTVKRHRCKSDQYQYVLSSGPIKGFH